MGNPNPKIPLYHSFGIYFSGNIMKMGEELFKEREYQEVCCEVVSHKNCGISNIGTLTVSMEKLMKKKKI